MGESGSCAMGGSVWPCECPPASACGCGILAATDVESRTAARYERSELGSMALLRSVTIEETPLKERVKVDVGEVVWCGAVWLGTSGCLG